MEYTTPVYGVVIIMIRVCVRSLRRMRARNLRDDGEHAKSARGGGKRREGGVGKMREWPVAYAWWPVAQVRTGTHTLIARRRAYNT